MSCQFGKVGSGLGLVSILLSKLQPPPSHLVATDGDDIALGQLRKNCDMNGVGEGIKVEKLRWGEGVEEFHLSHGPFDMIVGADVIYEEEYLVPLFQTVKGLMDSADSVFVLSFARRNVSIELVTSTACHLGFEQSTPPTFHPSNPNELIYFFKLTSIP